MFTQKRKLRRVWFLQVAFLLAVPIWAQVTASDAYTLTSPSNTTNSNSQSPQGPTGTNGSGFYSNPLNPAPSFEVREVGVHDIATANSASGAIKEEVTEVVADRNSVNKNLPATLTVSAAALLELHAMRKSAVDLCIELPTKYRTRLPECADIFKHEIRLQGLAKNHH